MNMIQFIRSMKIHVLTKAQSWPTQCMGLQNVTLSTSKHRINHHCLSLIKSSHEYDLITGSVQANANNYEQNSTIKKFSHTLS